MAELNQIETYSAYERNLPDRLSKDLIKKALLIHARDCDKWRGERVNSQCFDKN